MVSVAGPAMNFILAFLFAIIYMAIVKFGGTFLLTPFGELVNITVVRIVAVNIGLGLFNLIPLPPLDGYKLFIKFLPYKAKEAIYKYEQYFHVIFLIIWITGAATYIIGPINLLVTNGFLKVAGLIFGIG